jgi:hypothetical protein
VPLNEMNAHNMCVDVRVMTSPNAVP